MSAVLSSQVSGDKSARTISKHPAVLEFMVNVDMEDNMVRIEPIQGQVHDPSPHLRILSTDLPITMCTGSKVNALF